MNLFAVAFVVFADQLSKLWAKENLYDNDLQTVIPNRLYFLKTKNYGLPNNYLSGKPSTVKKITTLAVVSSFVYAATALKKTGGCIKAAFSLMLGGGLSNLADRYVNGYVTDFICFKNPKAAKPSPLVYNVADFFIFIGSAIFVICSLFEKED